MGFILATISTAFFAFLATEIDDFAIFIIFYALNRQNAFKIFVGQFTALLIVSLSSAFISLALAKLPLEYIKFLGLVPLALGIIKLFKKQNENDSSIENSNALFITSFLLTITSSVDNIGIYIPLFAVQTLNEKLITLLTFFTMQILWSFLQFKASSLTKKIIPDASHYLVSIIYITIGFKILFF